MLTVADVYAYVNGRAPFDTQMDFDNAGLLTGAMDQPVTGIHVALDCTEGVIQEAERLGANLIVTGDVLCQKMGTNSSTNAANSTWQVLQQDESFAVSGATITCNKAGTYTYEFRAVTGNVWNGEGRAYLRKNGSNVTSVGSTKGVLAKTETGTMELAEGDTVTAYLYARAGVGDWSGNSEVYVEHLKLALEK